jgi:DNA-binding transcriptional MocR family regulator
MASTARERYRTKRGRKVNGPPFVQLHKFMLATPAWLALSCPARAAYVQVASRYDGLNNGSIGIGVRALAREMRCSPDTASRALIELEDAGFIETVKLGAFKRKDRKASEYRLAMYRCDLSGHPPSKRFMQWAAQSDHKDRTVRPQGQSRTKPAPQSDYKDRQSNNSPAHSPSGRTHIESNHGRLGSKSSLPAYPELPTFLDRRQRVLS